MYIYGIDIFVILINMFNNIFIKMILDISFLYIIKYTIGEIYQYELITFNAHGEGTNPFICAYHDVDISLAVWITLSLYIIINTVNFIKIYVLFVDMLIDDHYECYTKFINNNVYICCKYIIKSCIYNIHLYMFFIYWIKCTIYFYGMLDYLGLVKTSYTI